MHIYATASLREHRQPLSACLRSWGPPLRPTKSQISHFVFAPSPSCYIFRAVCRARYAQRRFSRGAFSLWMPYCSSRLLRLCSLRCCKLAIVVAFVTARGSPRTFWRPRDFFIRRGSKAYDAHNNSWRLMYTWLYPHATQVSTFSRFFMKIHFTPKGFPWK